MNYRVLFLISLVINVVLGLWLLQKKAPPSTIHGVQRPDVAALLPVSGPGTVATYDGGKRFDWESVESPDYRQYIANLRAVGCPEETLRDIVEADVTKLYDEKKRRVRKEAPRFEYWKGDSFLREAGRKAWIEMRTLDEERDTVLRDLGIEPDYSKRALKERNAHDWMLDFLSDEKRREINRLRQELIDTLATRDPNVTDESAHLALFREHETAVKRLLTPEEALQYDLRVSPVAQGLRNEMRYMDATEEEFVALYKLLAAHHRDHPPVGPEASDAERRAVRESNEKLQEQMRELLGTDRYSDYQMSQDWRFAFTYKFGQAAGLGMPEMKQIYQVRKEAERAAEQIENDSGLSAESRTAALRAIRQEAERVVSGAMGQQIWGRYQNEGHDGWLNTISKSGTQ